MLDYDVIVPTHANLTQKGGSLGIALTSISNAPIPPKRIFVVSNGDAAPPDAEYVTSTCEGNPLTHPIFEVTASRARARNVGLSACEAEWVLFMDDDIIVSPEAVEVFSEACRRGGFSCGARRRYIPFGWEHGAIKEIVLRGRLHALDSLASDEHSLTAGPMGDSEGQPHMLSFVGCFGGARRADLIAIGGFNEDYAGWGLEDTDLMRRLLAEHDFLALSGCTIWHLDHLVPPYIWSEHWHANWPVYIEETRERGFLQVTSLLSKQHVCAGDPLVLLRPIRCRDTETALLASIGGSVADTLDSYVDDAMKDSNVAAVVLGGSTTRSRAPKDIDVSRVVFYGRQRFSSPQCGTIPVDEHTISLRSVKSILKSPQYMPDTWPWWAHRYYSGRYLWQAVDCRSLLRHLIEETLEAYWLHFLTYHLGKALALCGEPSQFDRGESLHHVSALVALGRSSLPCQRRFPYLESEDDQAVVRRCATSLCDSSPDQAQRALLDCLRDTITKTINEHAQEEHGRKIIYKESLGAVEAIEAALGMEIHYTWTPLAGQVGRHIGSAEEAGQGSPGQL